MQNIPSFIQIKKEFVFFLFPVLVIEIEGQLYALPENILDVDVDGLLIRRSGNIE